MRATAFMWGKPKTRGLFQAAAVLSTDVIHWCWRNAPTLNQWSHKYCVINFLCLKHWHLFWKLSFFSYLKYNVPHCLGSSAEVSQSWSSPEVAAHVPVPARTTLHLSALILSSFCSGRKKTVCIRPFVPLAESPNVKGLYTRRKRGHDTKVHINKHTLKNLFSW